MHPTNPWWATPHPNNDPTRHHKGHLTRVLTTLTLLFFFITLAPVGTPPDQATRWDGATITYQNETALTAQCGPTYTYPTTAAAHRTAKNNPRVRPWPGTTVPILGPMSTTPAPNSPRFYTETDTLPTPGNLIRSMWDGRIVVYYTPQLNTRAVTMLHTMSERDDLNIIVLPWTSPAELPLNRSVAFAAFGASQSCHKLSPQALEQFRAAFPEHQSPAAQHKTLITEPTPTNR